MFSAVHLLQIADIEAALVIKGLTKKHATAFKVSLYFINHLISKRMTDR